MMHWIGLPWGLRSVVPIDLSDFKIHQAALELRYSPAFLLWDKAGTIWRKVASHYPELRARNVEPNTQSFRFYDRTDGIIQTEKCYITTFFPGNLDEFKKLSSIFFEEVLTKLEIISIDRIGFRLILEKKFNSQDDLLSFVSSSLKSKPSKGKYFNIEGRLREFEHAMRWEDESKGCTARLKAVVLKVDIDAPREFEDLSPVHSQRSILTADADMYTLLPVSVGKFSSVAIIEDWARLIRRDFSEFMDV